MGSEEEASVARSSARPVGTTGHEILADGQVVARTADGHSALLILALLTKADEDGLTK